MQYKIIFNKQFCEILALIFFYILLSIFFIKYFKNIDWDQIQNAKFNWPLVFGAALSLTGIRFLYPMVWIGIINDLGYHIKNYYQLNYAYAKAWMGRYIPGKVAWIGGKIYFGSKQGLDTKMLTIVAFSESVIQLISTILMGFLFVGSKLYDLFPFKAWVYYIILSIFSLVTVFPPVSNRLISIVYKITKKKELEAKYLFTSKIFCKTLIKFIGILILSGLPYFFICRSVVPNLDVIEYFFYIVGSVAFAGAIGILAVFAPSGIGVRDGILALLFTQFAAKEEVLILVILFRIIAVIVDILFFFLSLLLSRRHQYSDR